MVTVAADILKRKQVKTYNYVELLGFRQSAVVGFRKMTLEESINESTIITK